MAAAFPFLAIAVGATLLIEHLVKLHEQAEKTAEAQAAFGTSIQKSFNSLEDKFIEAGIKADELNKDHLGALAKQIELIDHQSLKELEGQFDAVDKAAESVLTKLTAHWYSLSKGSGGAAHAFPSLRPNTTHY